jgi:hypothetical protein
MCNTAAHLTDRVFSDVPVRQWVLSVPFELRLLISRRADVFRALIRLFARELLGWQRERAAQAGILAPYGAGVSFPQRFGGSLNLNTHIHSIFCDGVFSIKPDRPSAFHTLSPPESSAIDQICARVAERFERWLRQRGLLLDEADHGSNEQPPLLPIDACTQSALGVGVLGPTTRPLLENSLRIFEQRPHAVPDVGIDLLDARATIRADLPTPNPITMRRFVAVCCRCVPRASGSIPGASTLFLESIQTVQISSVLRCRQVAVTCRRAA